jgi:hypothetical protein
MALGRYQPIDMVSVAQASPVREALAARQAMFERAEAFATSFARNLDKCAAIHTIIARELAATYSMR